MSRLQLIHISFLLALFDGQGQRTHKSWPIALIAELHHARYLLQPRALELVLSNRSSALLSFATPKVRCYAEDTHLHVLHLQGNCRLHGRHGTDDGFCAPATHLTW